MGVRDVAPTCRLSKLLPSLSFLICSSETLLPTGLPRSLKYPRERLEYRKCSINVVLSFPGGCWT